MLNFGGGNISNPANSAQNQKMVDRFSLCDQVKADDGSVRLDAPIASTKRD